MATVSLYMPEYLQRRFKRFASDAGLSLSELVRATVAASLDDYETGIRWGIVVDGEPSGDTWPTKMQATNYAVSRGVDPRYVTRVHVADPL